MKDSNNSFEGEFREYSSVIFQIYFTEEIRMEQSTVENAAAGIFFKSLIFLSLSLLALNFSISYSSKLQNLSLNLGIQKVAAVTQQ